jgi:hypothetical protein
VDPPHSQPFVARPAGFVVPNIGNDQTDIAVDLVREHDPGVDPPRLLAGAEHRASSGRSIHQRGRVRA